MKHTLPYLRSLAVAIMLLLSNISKAQMASGYGWKMPRKSPKASVTQTLGVTEITIKYSRPQTNGRAIFGKNSLVPYNKIWRVGANEATTISFTTAVKFDSVIIPKGKYALFILPESEKSWIFILNKKHDQWGAYGYDKSLDVLRYQVDLKKIEPQESLLFIFDHLKPNEVMLKISWGIKSIAIPIKVDLEQTVKDFTSQSFNWESAFFAAQYYFNEREDSEQALKWVNSGLALEENLSLLNLKIEIYKSMDNKKEGLRAIDKIIAITRGNKDSRSKYFLKKAENLKIEWK